MLKYQMEIANPDELSHKEWAAAYRDYTFLRKREIENMEVAFGRVMSEVLKSFKG